MIVRGTRLRHYDHNGGAVAELATNAGTFAAAHRAFTQSDKNAFFAAAHPSPIAPSSVALYDCRLDPETTGQLAGNPGAITRKANDGVFTRVQNLKDRSLGILAGHTPTGVQWDERIDPFWIHAGAAARSHVTALIGRKSETRESLERRMKAALVLNESKPELDQRIIAPVLRTDARHFTDLVDYLLEQAFEVLGFEVRGVTNSRASLGYFHQALDRAVAPPWTFALNAPRYHNHAHGSGTLMIAGYGIQSVAPQVFYGNPAGEDTMKEPDDPRRMWWFDSPDGGYERYNMLPAPENGCPCPNERRILVDEGNLGSMLAARRRHETWAHMADQPTYVRHVAEQSYDEYLDARQRLKSSVASLP